MFEVDETVQAQSQWRVICSSEDLQESLRILVDNVREPERTAQALALQARDGSSHLGQRSEGKQSIVQSESSLNP